jgi:hypothetical protein
MDMPALADDSERVMRENYSVAEATEQQPEKKHWWKFWN